MLKNKVKKSTKKKSTTNNKKKMNSEMMMMNNQVNKTPTTLPKKQVNKRPTKSQSNQVQPVKPQSQIKNKRPVKKPIKPQPTQPTKSQMKMMTTNQPNNNNLSTPQSNLSSTSNISDVDTSNKKYMKALKTINDTKIIDVSQTLFNQTQNETNPPTLQTFTRNLNKVKKVLIDNKLMITDQTTLIDLLNDNYDMITKNIDKSDSSYSKKRSDVASILFILSSSPNQTSLNDYRKYENYRKTISPNSK